METLAKARPGILEKLVEAFLKTNQQYISVLSKEEVQTLRDSGKFEVTTYPIDPRCKVTLK